MYWDRRQIDAATCLYGEVTVLATHSGIYFCGANWNPGCPAGGYCGIQHHEPSRPPEKWAYFSIWDSVENQQVSEALGIGTCTTRTRFTNEGCGAKTCAPFDWRIGRPFRFFLRKTSDHNARIATASFYVYDDDSARWRLFSTITTPFDETTVQSVTAIGASGGLVSFLENFTGKDRSVAKLALYRLWLGSDVDNMVSLTEVEAHGLWGKLSDCFFLAEGGEKELSQEFERLRPEYGLPEFGQGGKRLSPITERPVPPDILRGLKDVLGEA